MGIEWFELPTIVRYNLWKESENHDIEWKWFEHELKTFNARAPSYSIIFETEANYAMFLLRWG